MLSLKNFGVMDWVAKMILSHFCADHAQDCECDRWLDYQTDKKGKPNIALRKVNYRKQLKTRERERERENTVIVIYYIGHT